MPSELLSGLQGSFPMCLSRDSVLQSPYCVLPPLLLLHFCSYSEFIVTSHSLWAPGGQFCLPLCLEPISASDTWKLFDVVEERISITSFGYQTISGFREASVMRHIFGYKVYRQNLINWRQKQITKKPMILLAPNQPPLGTKTIRSSIWLLYHSSSLGEIGKGLLGRVNTHQLCSERFR